jgi:hypothetical protein
MYFVTSIQSKNNKQTLTTKIDYTYNTVIHFRNAVVLTVFSTF